MATKTIIPATPGWFLCVLMGDEFSREAILAWEIKHDDEGDRTCKCITYNWWHDEGHHSKMILDGSVVQTKNGPREHPLLKSELACRSFVVRGLQRLGLADNSRPVGRPGYGGLGWISPR